MKLLIVEDNPGDLQNYRDSIVRFQREKNYTVTSVESANLADALNKVDASFDGAIIDLKLGSQSGAGNTIVERIEYSSFRIPVIIFTGTPEDADKDFSYIGVYKKGEVRYQQLLEMFFEIYNTGLTKIMGGRGKIEAVLDKVFRENLIPNLKPWISHGKNDPERAERALLRHTLNHLIELLEEETEDCYPEEVYIYPPISQILKPGSIVKKRNSALLYIIMTPACDLVLRQNAESKTDSVLLIEIEPLGIIANNALEGIVKAQKRFKATEELAKNNYRPYYHWLPEQMNFLGGFINFRRVVTTPIETFLEHFETPQIQVSSAFVKDILSRFSTYYARQGQPDIDKNSFIRSILENQ